jgi:hypothetical protein
MERWTAVRCVTGGRTAFVSDGQRQCGRPRRIRIIRIVICPVFRMDLIGLGRKAIVFWDPAALGPGLWGTVCLLAQEEL